MNQNTMLAVLLVGMVAGSAAAAAPSPVTVQRMKQTGKMDAKLDLQDHWFMHRDAATNDATTSWTMEQGLALAFFDANSSQGHSVSRCNKLYAVEGAANVCARFWGADTSDSSANNATVSITIVGWSEGANTNGANTNYSGDVQLFAEGEVLFKGDLTFGSDATTNKNPVTGDANTSGYFACDTIVETKDTGGNSLTANVIYDGAGDNRCATLTFDPRGNKYVYVYTHDRSGITECLVALRRIGG